MSKLFPLAEKIFVVITLFLSSSALIPVLLDSEGGGIESDPYTPILFMGIYLVTILLILDRWKSFLRVAPKNILIWLIVILALASVSWSVAPHITQRRSFLVLGTTLFSIYCSSRFSLRQQLHLLAWNFGIIVVLSYIFALALPSLGLMTFQEGGIHAGAWRGILSHKNIMGRLINVSAIVFLLVASDNPIKNPRYRWLPWAGYVLSVLLILLSTSKTALIVCLTMTAILPLYQALRKKYTFVVPFLIAVVLVGGSATMLLIDNLPVIASAMGKDLTLTGRTDIWAVMSELIALRPVFGYGFNAFWLGWETDISAYVWRTLQWECPYGHNGFMDLAAELGLSTLIIFFLSYFIGYGRGLRWLRITKTSDGLWPLMYFSYLVMYNLTESTLLASNSIFWLLYVSINFSLIIDYNQAKKMKYFLVIDDETEAIEEVLES